ncbi:hypothetical protein [Acinetobacter sp.]|uniref:hypothetical protein n=1 Tax=Acinetobacter sp. TaxID=472 RepID=UPI003D0676E8
MDDMYDDYDNIVVRFAHDIIDMHEKIVRLKKENALLRKYRDDYNRLLDEGVKHNQAMMGQMLKATLNMNPDQIEAAFGEDNKEEF